MNKTKTQFKGVLILFLTAAIWGTSFVAQSVGLEDVGPFTFSGIRTLMGACTLLPFLLVRERMAARTLDADGQARRKEADRKTLKYGLILGCVFCVATNFQQFAFPYSTAGKIAFITALYMFFVPLFGIFLRKKVPLLTWVCVFFGFVGLFFLCMNPNDMSAINKGDVLTIICSVFFAVHILLIERFAPEVDGIKLSCIQFATAGVISCILMFLLETPNFADIRAAILPMFYSGVMSCGVAYTFQIIGQKYTEATVASLIMCMESVFGVLSSALILHETLSGREIFGCVIMFAAIVLSQLSDPITEALRARRANPRSPS